MKTNRRKIISLIIISAFFVLITVIISILFQKFYDFGGEDTNREVFEQYYVMITEDNESPFWNSVYQGAASEGRENGIYVELLGDNLSQSYDRLALMRMAIASDVDGIMVTADESPEMTALINEAVACEIPVVTMYSDCSHSNRCSFVGVGNYNLGKEFAAQVLGILNERSFDSDTVRIALLSDSEPKESGTNLIFSTFKEATAEYTGEKELDVSLVPVDGTNKFSVEESVRTLLTASRETRPDIIVCLTDVETTSAYQAVVDYNMVGDVSILGYYDSEAILKGIQREAIYSTVSVDTLQMGKYAVEALREYREMGLTSQYFTADITIIDSGNVAGYLKGGDSDER